MAQEPQFVRMYDFLENLGKGHFAVVKRAQHVISKEQVRRARECRVEDGWSGVRTFHAWYLLWFGCGLLLLCDCGTKLWRSDDDPNSQRPKHWLKAPY